MTRYSFAACALTAHALILAAIPMAYAADAPAAACVKLADNSRTYADGDAFMRTVTYSGADAQMFVGGMSLMLGDLPAAVMAASSVSAYLNQSTGVATVRYYDTRGCDVGVDTEMAGNLLNTIVDTIGVHI